MKRIVSILFLIVVITNFVVAQKLTTAVSKSKVAVGEMFQIQFSLSGSNANIKLPNLSDFDIYQGPFQSSSMSITNGNVSQSISVTYVIAAKKEGKFTIGSASVNANGATVQSNPVAIEVIKGAANQATQPNSNQGNAQTTAPSSGDISDNLFVKTEVSKTKTYVGEEISVIFKLYTRMDVLQLNVTAMPSCDGFFMQESKANAGQSNETVNGVNYMVGELKRTFMIPQHTGKLVIDPMELECIVRQRSNKKPRDIFEQMLGGYENAQYKIKSKPVTIDVQPLPEKNKPADFSGAVGDYAYRVELSKDNVKTNDAVNLTITLTGKGNIKLVDAPKINFPEDFETYDPKVKENITAGANGVSGTKSFDYLLIPRHGGDYKIDNLNFTFFDPQKNEYITLPSPELNIHVEKGKEDAAVVIGAASNHQTEVKELGSDIRFIKTKNIRVRPKDEYFFGSPLFYAGVISPFLVFIGFVFIRRRTISQNSDLVAVKSRKATKMAKKRLILAEQYLKSDNKELFYIEIFKALYGYIGDKLNIPVADLSKENISATLKEKNIHEEIIGQLLKTIDNCEYARYAPSAVSGDLQGIYNNTVELITKIENEIR
jgi:hypothetical protein